MKRCALVLMALMTLLGVSCHGEREYKISIFGDHIRSMTRQENISFVEAAQRLREVGYTGVDVNITQSEEELDVLDSLGFEHACAIVHIEYNKEGYEQMEQRAIDFIQQRGYDRLLLVPGYIGKDATEEQRAHQRRLIANYVKRVRSLGYDIFVEDFDNVNSICYGIDNLEAMFEAVPDLGFAYDSGNFLMKGEDCLVALDMFIDRVQHVHLKDRRSVEDQSCLAPGYGCIPIVESIKRLDAAGYDGWYTVEHYGSKQMMEDATNGYAVVRATLESL